MRFALGALFLMGFVGPAKCVQTARADTTTLAPLRAEWLEPLADAGYVAVPIGATGRRPIVVAVHGAGDRPEWSCSEWRAIFGPAPFVVCPRGSALDAAGKSGFAWSGAAHVERAIEKAVDATRARYGAYLAEDAPRVYVGFSQGARIGASVVAHAPARYPVAVFLEGLGDVASPAFTTPLRAAGKRVLLACSQRGCAASREKAARALERAGVEARVLDVGPVGHTVDARVVAAVRREVPWLLDGVAAWADVRRAVSEI